MFIRKKLVSVIHYKNRKHLKYLLLHFLIIVFATQTITAQSIGSINIVEQKKDLQTINAKIPNNIGNADEIFLKLTYAGLVNTTVIAYYYNNQFYFPFKEVCDNLEIINKVEQNKISGFLNTQTNTYQIYFNPNKVILRDTSNNFTFNDFLKSDFDFFFDKEFFEKIFGVKIKTDFGTLTSSVQSKEMLPIFQRYQREKTYEIFANKKGKDAASILYPRKRKIIGGGILDYNAGYNVGKGQELSTFYNFRLGGELFGGDVQIATSGDMSMNRSNNTLDYLWRYVFDKNDYISTVTMGKTSLDGLYNINYTGIRISNDQVEPRRTYATRRVYEKTRANWSVEIYVSNQLIAVTKADAVGDFYFDMPLSYGTTLLEMKFYGPGGEYYEQNRLYQTPYYLLRPNEFVYFANFGNVENYDKNLASIKGGYGVTEWLTTELGFQYLEDNISEKVFYNSTTARLFGEYLLNVTIAPEAYYQFSADVLYFSQASFGFEYKKFTKNGYMNPGRLNSDLGINFFLPFRFDYSQLNLKGSFNYAENTGLELFDYELGTSASLDGFNPSVTYNFVRSISNGNIFDKEYLDLGLSYFLGSLFRGIPNISGSLLTLRSFYNTKDAQFENYSISLSTTIRSKARIQFSHSHNFRNSDNSMQLQLIIYLDNVQVNTSLALSGFRLGALGSLTYDQVTKEVIGFNRAQVGRGSALFKFYVDSNGNSEFDSGEEIINNGNVIMGTSVVQREDNGIIRARELDPYTIYTVDIDETAIRNPLLVPGIKRFSFVSDPNSVKNIEIPFYIAGEIDGRVSRKVGNTTTPVSGIKIHIKNIKDEKVETISTYSDGIYYFFGLRPGKYIAYLDEEHLKILGSKSVKPIKFEIEPKKNGDIVMDVNFIIE